MAKKHEEMFNIHGHKGNVNQNHVMIPSRFHQEHKQQGMLGRMWGEKQHSYTVGRNIN
jgi:hypothetical protein